MSKFAIGDRVRVRNYDDIPEGYKSSGTGRMCGEVGTIEDVFSSSAMQCDLYGIQFDNYDIPSKKLWRAEQLEAVDETVTYDFEFEILENLVVARLYEIKEDTKTEIGKGHGHIFHDGAVGIAQASSYALKRLYYKMAGMED